MKIASWIVITHFRPEYLVHTLDHLRGMRWPDGWQAELVVAAHHDDRRGVDIAKASGATVATTSSMTPGGKRNAALRVISGELVLTCDDDDFPSPLRPAEAISAYLAGHGLSGIREYRRLHVPSGMVCRWLGRGDFDVAPVYITMSRNYKANLLHSVRGWNDHLLMMEETDLHQRIQRRHHGAPSCKIKLERDLGPAQADTTIFLQHDRNLIADRPIVPVGEKRRVGPYFVLGEGHWSQTPGFPSHVAERLGL
jgi:hypothetical protein